jgi:hypothetical protein
MSERRRLVNRRPNETFSFSWRGMHFTATISALLRDPRGVASGPLGAALDLIAPDGWRPLMTADTHSIATEQA